MHTSSVASVTSNAVRLLCPWDSPRQEYWSELPFPTSGDLLDPETKPKSPASLALAGRFFTTELPGKPVCVCVQTDTDKHKHTHVVYYFLLFKIVVIKFFSIVQYIYCEARAKVNKRVFMLTHSMLFRNQLA